ncbi:MAG: hypothetical protein QNL04_10625 [SAR324 cluster bacterium]|nr:hypothetical protein [SAR324 cluster bacterium]
MIDTIVNNWFLWLIGGSLGGLLLQFIGKTRSTEVQPGMATKSDEFSMKAVFFSFRSGEASLFLTVTWVLVCFYCFAVALATHIADALPGTG